MMKRARLGLRGAIALLSVLAIANPLFAAAPDQAFDGIIGKWVRPDGGYIIEIKGVDAGGKLDAAYYNPTSIHISKAEASLDGDAVKVFIEFQDVNYPGSNYHLVYDPQADQLKGDYYQAVDRERYEIFFERMN
jgi:uncharacterized protein (DUF2147 family)